MKVCALKALQGRLTAWSATGARKACGEHLKQIGTHGAKGGKIITHAATAKCWPGSALARGAHGYKLKK